MKKITLLLMVLMGLATSSWAQCASNFTYVDNGSGNVTFTNTSTGGFSTTNWNFGDGNTSTAYSPTHTYAATGAYAVCLLILDSTQTCVDTYCDSVYVTVNSGGGCSASFIPNSNGSGTTVFSNTSTGGFTNSFWDFGDGNTSGVFNPSHTYTSTGYYLVCLTISDTFQNCYDTYCDTVYANVNTGGGCSASFISNSNGSGTTVFSNTSTGGFTNYFWDFGDGNTSGAFNPSHTYATSGSYIVCLTISDSTQNCYDTYCDSVYVNVNTGGCNLNFNLSANGTTITANNTSTGASSYDWYIWDAAGFFDHIQNTTQLTYTVPTGGNYTVCLYGFDANGAFCDSTCQNITVVGQGTGCNANFSFMIDSLGNNIIVNNSTSAGPVDYFWDFGDGSTGTGATPPPHTYNTPGPYIVCLTISDTTQNCYDTFCDTIFIPQTGLSTIYFSNNTAIGIDEVAQSVTGLSVYPNPVSNQATVAFDMAYSGKVELQVFNTTGQLVRASSLHLSPGAQQIQLEASDFTKGVYFVRLQTERNEHFQTKFIKY